MKVLKFGGTSVSSVETVRNISEILKKSSENQIVVCSALSKVTNMLEEAAKKASEGDVSYKEVCAQIEKRHYDFIDELIQKEQQGDLKQTIHNHIASLEKVLEAVYFLNELSQRAYYIIVSFGEKMSNAIIFRYLTIHNGSVNYLDSSQIIITRTVNGKEDVNRSVTNKNILENWNKDYKITVAPGFISKSEKGYATTLGRGGSDYTAAIYAAALDASILEIWTDVSGIYTADPRKVKDAQPLEKMSYKEALELSNLGAKVIYAPTVQPVLEKNIPMVILNTFRPDDKGTLVTIETDPSKPIKSFSTMDNIAMLTFTGTGLVGNSGIAGRLFNALKDVNVIIISQACSEMSISVVISAADAQRAVNAINEEFDFEIRKNYIKPITAETGYSILAMVGEGMKNAAGMTGKAFTALGENNINIHLIAQGSSELNVSIVIKTEDSSKALNCLHKAFF
ncbi:MAG: aspartate kinase [Bacteroidales bacterium]|nr:aspartate kinase [Bacteroidales bacterium]